MVLDDWMIKGLTVKLGFVSIFCFKQYISPSIIHITPLGMFLIFS